MRSILPLVVTILFIFQAYISSASEIKIFSSNSLDVITSYLESLPINESTLSLKTVISFFLSIEIFLAFILKFSADKLFAKKIKINSDIKLFLIDL